MNSNSIYYKDKCPAIMADSRLFTNYMSQDRIVSYISKINCLKNNLELKNFLQQNSDTIIKNENNYHINEKKCNFKHFQSKLPQINETIQEENELKKKCNFKIENNNHYVYSHDKNNQYHIFK